MAFTRSGWQWPTLVTSTPEVQSRKTLPSTSVMTQPEPRSHTTGAWYPVHCASTFSHRSNKAFERGPGSCPFTRAIFTVVVLMRNPFPHRGTETRRKTVPWLFSVPLCLCVSLSRFLRQVPRRLAGQETIRFQHDQLADGPG